MTKVCTGWIHPHAVVTMHDDGVADGKVSHGMCPACKQKVDGELDTLEQRGQSEYEAYLKNPTYDPRD